MIDHASSILIKNRTKNKFTYSIFKIIYLIIIFHFKKNY